MLTDIAQEKLDTYRNDLDALKPALIKSKLVGLTAIVALLFLLGLADVVAWGHAYDGWFPDWPGGKSFEAFFNPETGPMTIPQYWI